MNCANANSVYQASFSMPTQEPWIKANLFMNITVMQTPPRTFQSPDCGNSIGTNVFNQTFRIYTPLQHRPDTPG